MESYDLGVFTKSKLVMQTSHLSGIVSVIIFNVCGSSKMLSVPFWCSFISGRSFLSRTSSKRGRSPTSSGHGNIFHWLWYETDPILLSFDDSPKFTKSPVLYGSMLFCKSGVSIFFKKNGSYELEKLWVDHQKRINLVPWSDVSLDLTWHSAFFS